MDDGKAEMMLRATRAMNTGAPVVNNTSVFGAERSMLDAIAVAMELYR